MAGKLAMCSHALVRGDSTRWKLTIVEHCLMSGFLPTGRSVRDDPDDGFVNRRWGC